MARPIRDATRDVKLLVWCHPHAQIYIVLLDFLLRVLPTIWPFSGRIPKIMDMGVEYSLTGTPLTQIVLRVACCTSGRCHPKHELGDSSSLSQISMAADSKILRVEL